MIIDLENKYFGNIQKTLKTILNYLHKLNSFLKLNLSQNFLLFSILMKTTLKKIKPLRLGVLRIMVLLFIRNSDD